MHTHSSFTACDFACRSRIGSVARKRARRRRIVVFGAPQIDRDGCNITDEQRRNLRCRSYLSAMDNMRLRASECVRLADNSVVFGMSANPEPHNAIVDIRSEGAVTIANPDGPDRANAFEVQRGVARVALEKSETLLCEGAGMRGKSLV